VPMATGVCDFLVAFRFLGVIRTRGGVGCVEKQRLGRMEPYEDKIVGAQFWGVVELLPCNTGGGGSFAQPRWAVLRTPTVRQWTVGSFSRGTSVADGLVVLLAAGVCDISEGMTSFGVNRTREVVGCVEH